MVTSSVGARPDPSLHPKCYSRLRRLPRSGELNVRQHSPMPALVARIGSSLIASWCAACGASLIGSWILLEIAAALLMSFGVVVQDLRSPATHTGVLFIVGALFVAPVVETYFPVLIERTARVVSRCASTGMPVSLTVTPGGIRDLEPVCAALSLILPRDSPDIRHAFCCEVHFFASAVAGQQWAATHPGIEV